MPFVATEQVLERIADLMKERLEKRARELGTQFEETVQRVRQWSAGDWDFPETSRGAYPMGLVDLDDEGRTSERREQDTGETAEVPILIQIAVAEVGSKEGTRRRVLRYGDAVVYTLMREAHGKRPRDGTVLPGWFRVWPERMRTGVFEEYGVVVAEVRARVVIDTQDDFGA